MELDDKELEMIERRISLMIRTELEALKKEILAEVTQLIRKGTSPILKRWMKSADLMKELEISNGKLQTMRNSRIITFTKVGGAIYYDREDVEAMFEKNKVTRNGKK